MDFLNTVIFRFGTYTLNMSGLIKALIIFSVTLIILFVAKRIIEGPKILNKSIDYKRRHSIFMIFKYFVWILSILFILDAFGFQITIILAGSAALLVGIGLGLQNIFSDLISGIFLLFEGTIKIGDIIEVDQVIGKVIEINLRSSELMTRDGVTIIIPNSKFIVEKVINWSHNADSVRFIIDVGVSYGSDVDDVIKILQECLLEHKKVEKIPEPFIRFNNFGESSLDFQLIFWTKDPFMVENTKSDIRKSVYRSLTKEGITIPFPQRDLHIISKNTI
jgi:small-conductance mechanosensitive channel